MTDHADTIRAGIGYGTTADEHDAANASLDAFEAERQQAIDERDAAKRERDNWHASNHAERQARLEAEVRCEQAIDALREIERLSRPTGPPNTLHPPGRVEIGSLKQASAIARAALVSLGETE